MKKQITFTPITSIWYEETELFIRAKVRAGLFTMPISETKEMHFLAGSFHEDNENGRVFKFVGVKEKEV